MSYLNKPNSPITLDLYRINLLIIKLIFINNIGIHYKVKQNDNDNIHIFII